MKKYILLIAAIYNASLGQCYGYGTCNRIGIIKRINDSHHHQLRGNNYIEIGRVDLCDNVVDEEFVKFDLRNMKDEIVENFDVDKELLDPDNPIVYKVVDHKIGESVWFYGTNLPPNCNESDDEPRCNIILSDSPSCHDEDAFQKSKTIRQMHYITDHEGNAGHPGIIEKEGVVDATILKHNFPGLPGLVSRTASAHFTDQTGKRVACAIIESEEDSEKLIDDGPSSFYTKDITKKVGASLVLDERVSLVEWNTTKFVMQYYNMDPETFHLVPE